MTGPLCRQRLAGLLPDDVVGVPDRPVHVMLAGALLVFAVCCRRAPQRGFEFGRRGEGGVGSVHASGQSRGDLLQQPAVAIGILERGERTVTAPRRIRSAEAL